MRRYCRICRGHLGVDPEALEFNNDITFHPIVEGISASRTDFGFGAIVDLAEFGYYDIEFKSFNFERRLGLEIKTHSGVMRIDAETQVPFDFNHPFDT